MVTQSGATKRPTCQKCTKPARICLCNRLQTPALDNSVSVTILQHSLEKNHPLNSTRIATIGLKNVHVVTVSDVNFQARFFVWLLDSRCEMGRAKVDENSHLFGEMPSREQTSTILGDGSSGASVLDLDGQITKRNDFNGVEMLELCKNDTNLSGKFASNSELQSCIEASDIDVTIEKYGGISSYNHCWITPSNSKETSFDHLLTSDIAADDIRKGFVVKKLQKKPLEGINKYQEGKEFEIAIPPGSVLLFPSKESIDIEAVTFEVKNFIVLDGTWAKAKRMYSENPWLRLLPHVRLNIDKLSLYGEVRNQPRAGYLSTIESIVYALKAVGEDCEGLDGLLDVFKSMIGDQRRCQNERLMKASEI